MEPLKDGSIGTDGSVYWAVKNWCADAWDAEYKLKYGRIECWDTSRVTSFGTLMGSCRAGSDTEKVKLFNPDISGWNTAQATGMEAMFKGAKAFNRDIGGWNTGLVKDMEFMFDGAEAFNQDISDWNTERVTRMSMMFKNAAAFSWDITNWQTPLMKDPRSAAWMFKGATAWLKKYEYNKDSETAGCRERNHLLDSLRVIFSGPPGCWKQK